MGRETSITRVKTKIYIWIESIPLVIKCKRPKLCFQDFVKIKKMALRDLQGWKKSRYPLEEDLLTGSQATRSGRGHEQSEPHALGQKT